MRQPSKRRQAAPRATPPLLPEFLANVERGAVSSPRRQDAAILQTHDISPPPAVYSLLMNWPGAMTR
jgi:hypothetical protein